jgi:D-alanine-D-alanine ligase
VPINKQKEAQKIALKIHNNFNLGTYSRTDFIFANNIPFALEINTIPGLTSESLMPKAAKAAGINFGEFLEILIREAK